jgi:hypothetical protein
MPVTIEDVQEWVKLQWTGNAVLAALPLVGGLAPESVDVPQYGEFTVTGGQVQHNAGADYLQEFDVEIKTWNETGAANLGPFQLAIESVFQVRSRQATGLPNGRTLNLLCSLKDPGDMTEDPDTQRGAAVMVSRDKYKLLCQG